MFTYFLCGGGEWEGGREAVSLGDAGTILQILIRHVIQYDTFFKIGTILGN